MDVLISDDDQRDHREGRDAVELSGVDRLINVLFGKGNASLLEEILDGFAWGAGAAGVDSDGHCVAFWGHRPPLWVKEWGSGKLPGSSMVYVCI